MSYPLPFNPMKSPLCLIHGYLSHPKQHHKVSIQSHIFNYRVEVLVPSLLAPDFDTMLQRELEGNFYYQIELPLLWFLSQEFLTGILNKGHVIALSVDKRIDCEDSIAITGDGKIILSVTKDTYQSLGLPGKASKLSPDKQRFIIQIDLTKKAMDPTKKGFQRIKWCFEHNLSGNYNFLIALIDPLTGKTLPINFSKNSTKLPLTATKRILTSILIPNTTTLKIPPPQEPGLAAEVWQENALDFYEWVAMASLGSPSILSSGNKPDPYISIYSPPEPHQPGDATIFLWQGLIPSPMVDKIISFFRTHVYTPFFTLTTHGFSDAPISWIGKEHGYLTNGENGYTMLILDEEENRKHPYVMWQITGCSDEYL